MANVIKTINGNKGKVKIEKDYLIIDNLLVERQMFDMKFVNKNTEMETDSPLDSVQNKIEGKLKLVSAFAGKVTYLNLENGEQQEGDMILVDYSSNTNP